MTAPDVSKFPDPQTWATYMPTRSPKFKTHSTGAHAKNAINTGMNGGKWRYTSSAYIYEWVNDPEMGEGWVERFAVRPGDQKDSHPLWKTALSRKTRKPREVPQATIDKTIESILSAVQRV